MGSAFAGGEDDSWLNGDGSNTYHGINGLWTRMEADDWSGSLFDAASGHDTLAEIDADDLGQLYGKMLDKYRPGSIWLCNTFTKAVVFDSIMAAAGGNMNTQLAQGQPATYMGYPIVTSEKMYAPATAATQANDKVPIMFGRPDIGCSFGTRRGMTIALSADRYFELDQLAIRGTERYDIVNHNANPGTTVGPITGLALTT
jgi:HK97 family phage major capsid protein